ncbi:MAG: glycosyltransferase family 2 protein [Patescibacteria group bacterium]
MEAYLGVGRATDLKNTWDRRIYRALEIMPGFLAWGTLLLIVVLSFFIPAWMAVFVIAFDVYWLTKTIFLTAHMNVTFRTMRKNMKRDWRAELEGIESAAPELKGLAWNDIYHMVILPFATEPLSIVREGLAGLERSNYPLDKLIVVLAREERVKDSERIAQAVAEEFGNKFFKFIITSHPEGLGGETVGKGSNEAWAGHKAKEELIDPLRIPYERIVVSVFDIDTVVPEQFFACLTWHYLTALKPLRSSFQPVPVFTNNIWEAPAFARVFAFSTTFWQMIQQARPEQLVTFSSQSISFRAVVDAGFWQKNVVSEDSQIFWKCFLRYDGDWRTIPMRYPVFMDANVAPTFWQTIKNQYKQIRRWHYGVENNPYFLFGFLKNPRIPKKLKLVQSFQMIEKTHSSATNALIIFLLGWLPITVGGNEFTGTILSYNLPQITTFIMKIAMVGLITSATISTILLPPRPPNYGRLKWLWMVFQWLLFPINFVFFGAIPALDAQTRLMLGKYIGFWVTPKDRKSG